MLFTSSLYDIFQDEIEITNLIETTKEVLQTLAVSKRQLIDTCGKMNTFHNERDKYESNDVLLLYINESFLHTKQNISDTEFSVKNKNIVFLMNAYKKNMTNIKNHL